MLFQADICCGYLATTGVSKGYDCLHIPGAETEGMAAAAANLCGRGTFTRCCKTQADNFL